jgi:hypothetical protein
MLRTEFRILIPAIEYKRVGGLGNLVSSHRCHIRSCHSGCRYHVRFYASRRSPDRGGRVDHRSRFVINDLENTENMAIGEVVMWPNDISILGGIKLDVYMLSRENTEAVSTGMCDRLLLRTRIWS